MCFFLSDAQSEQRKREKAMEFLPDLLGVFPILFTNFPHAFISK